MRTVLHRKREPEDDVKTIHRRSTAVQRDASVEIPHPPESPLVVWGKLTGTLDDAESTRDCLEWPHAWNKRCHNCAHFFDGIPVPLPINRDELRRVYYCQGKFCSWQCAKSFNIRETAPAGRGNRNMYIALLAYKTWIKQCTDSETREKMKTYCDHRIDPALPRARLVEFGGDLTIEEYRKNFCGVLPPLETIKRTKSSHNTREMFTLPFVDIDRGSIVTDETGTKNVVASGTVRLQKDRAQEFNNSFVDRLKRARADPAIMKRKKKLDVSNTLLSSMGIEIKKRKALA